MVDPALGVLNRAMKMKVKGEPVALAVTAARDVLDRAGYKPTDRVVITDPAGEKLFASPAELLKAELAQLHERNAAKE